jgi:hypothetical protein
VEGQCQGGSNCASNTAFRPASSGQFGCHTVFAHSSAPDKFVNPVHVKSLVTRIEECRVRRREWLGRGDGVAVSTLGAFDEDDWIALCLFHTMELVRKAPVLPSVFKRCADLYALSKYGGWIKDAPIYSTYPSPHCMRASVCTGGEGILVVCRDGGAKRGAHTVRPQPFEFK